MNKIKWILVLLGLTLSVSAITRTTTIMKVNKRKLASCVLEDLATAGLGDVKYSILSEAEFQNVNGLGWVLMKGQNKVNLGIGGSEPSVFDYFATTDNASLNFLPDGRGLFLRGKNNGRADGAQNPDGENLLGTYQTDMFKSHTHLGAVYSDQNWYTTGPGASSGVSHGTPTQPTGGNETRSKNITVNTFVKVKRNCFDAIVINLINTNAVNITALQSENAKNRCDNCINLPERNLTELEEKLACFKNEIDLYEADQKNWSVTCTARTIGYAKKVLMLIGVNRSGDDNLWLNHLDNQYPYYNVVTVN